MENIIEIKGLKKSFGETAVLKHIDLTVQKGECVVILGKSGQGKSTTINCMIGITSPDEGSLKILGQEVSEMNEDDLKDLRTKIGFLFQGGALYDSMTVRENLSFALRRVLKIKDEQDIDNRCQQALEAVGLEDVMEKMPSELSGGMKKRIALARTLIVRPEIILYDEPTTGLDTITSKEISHLILHIQKKYQTTAVIITHDISCAKIAADRILIMEDGEYIAEGTFRELENSENEFISSFFK
ncbi:MAG: ABC transporter ATP-binding protein [Sediminibacterium sp.]